MAAKNGQMEKGKRGGEMVRIDRGGGGGGLLAVGCTLFAAAVAAAFMAHKARKSGRGRGFGGVDKREEKRGLQDLLPSVGWDGEDCGDSLDGSQNPEVKIEELENTIVKEKDIELIEPGNEETNLESGKGEEESEGTEASSTELNSESVWPIELVEQEKVYGKIPETTENKFDVEVALAQIEDNRVKELSFPDMVTETDEYHEEAIPDNVIDAFWTAKLNAPDTQTGQNLAEVEIVPVPNEGELDYEKMDGKIEEGSEVEVASSVEQEETSEKDEQFDLSEKPNEHAFVDNSEGIQENICNDSDTVVEESEKQSEANTINENTILQELDTTDVEEDKEEFQVEEKGERGEAEEFERSRNTFDESTELANLTEQHKYSVINYEVKHQMEIPRELQSMDENSRNLEEEEDESEGADNGVHQAVSNELEKFSVPTYEMNQSMESPNTINQGDDSMSGENSSILPSDDNVNGDMLADNSVAIQEDVNVSLDKKIEENLLVPSTDNSSNVVKECSSNDLDFSSAQVQNTQDSEERIAYVDVKEKEEEQDQVEEEQEEEEEEEDFSLSQDQNAHDLEKEEVSDIDEDEVEEKKEKEGGNFSLPEEVEAAAKIESFIVQDDETVKEGSEATRDSFLKQETDMLGIESGMKLQFEVPKRTIQCDEHEQKVTKKESQTIGVNKEKSLSRALGSLKNLFLLVLALLLALGLLAFIHHDHLDHYKRQHLPKLYQPLYDFLSPYYNRFIVEL